MDVQAIFDTWNSFPDHKNWRKHKFFSPGMKTTIQKWIDEGYPVEYLCEAVYNYYVAKTTRGTWWHDVCDLKWPMETFFKGGLKKDEYNWKRFEPERFDLESCFTNEYKRIRAIETRTKKAAEEREQFKNRPIEEIPSVDWVKLSEEKPDNKFYKDMAARQKKKNE